MHLQEVQANLERRGFRAVVFETAAEAAAYLNREIDKKTVGFGGSVTLKQMGLEKSLGAHNTVWWHNDPNQVAAYGVAELRRLAMTTDIYLASVNGMSEAGQMINIDGAGNRIASTAFGHRKVYLLVGKNKIAPTFDEAMWRARNIAAPKNAQRLQRRTPCAAKGDRCYDCSSPERICNGFLMFERALTGQETEVVLINEELGY